MEEIIPSTKQVLLGYDAVSALYPSVPPLSHWRAWEYAAYKRYRMKGRVLDLGCGDGLYFRLIWSRLKHVIGVDINPVVADLAKQSGVYSKVHVAEAHNIPESDESFDHVFANCSLEHMDHLSLVLGEVYRCLKPGGTLLCSVVTNRFIEWSLLHHLVDAAGYGVGAERLRREFVDYHHLANPLSVNDWIKEFGKVGFIAEDHVPILPKINSGIFLLMNNMWHMGKAGGGEMGDIFYPFLCGCKNFTGSFRKILEGLLEMETDRLDCSGAVFRVRKPGR